MNEQHRPSITPMSDARREAMLDELLARMQRLHRNRRSRRTALASTCLILLMLVLTLPAVTARRDRHERPVATEQPVPAVDIRIVRTDPTVLDRFTARPRSSAVIIDDESLLSGLALIGQPAGLIRMDNRVWLTADVVGAEGEGGGPPKPPPSL